jgi:hypothetical protein
MLQWADVFLTGIVWLRQFYYDNIMKENCHPKAGLILALFQGTIKKTDPAQRRFRKRIPDSPFRKKQEDRV